MQWIKFRGIRITNFLLCSTTPKLEKIALLDFNELVKNRYFEFFLAYLKFFQVLVLVPIPRYFDFFASLFRVSIKFA